MASRNIAFKVVNARKVSFAPLAADLAIGYTDDDNKFVGLFTIPDFILKKSKDKGYYFSGPSKPYMKDGEHQIDENGYKKYLEFFKLYSEKAGDKWQPTKAAFDARKYIIGLFVDALGQLGGEDSAPAPTAKKTAAKAPARATRPAAAKAVIDEEEVSAPGGDEDDDDLPF